MDLQTPNLPQRFPSGSSPSADPQTLIGLPQDRKQDRKQDRNNAPPASPRPKSKSKSKSKLALPGSAQQWSPKPSLRPLDAFVHFSRSPTMLNAIEKLRRAAESGLSLLIRGESGTGKELAARFVHQNSPRKNNKFVALNCAAIPESLAESELFGHCKGAFTHAQRQHQGAFAQAHGGTLFLDEIGELPLALQAKLLRVAESGRYRPVGSEQEQQCEVRLVAATHRPLEQMIAKGLFREDLFYRLSPLEVRLPALRERSADIPDLLRYFARLAQDKLGPDYIVQLSSSALKLAQDHPWPGNIRALRNAVFRSAVLHRGYINAHTLGDSLAPLAKAATPPLDRNCGPDNAISADGTSDFIQLPRGSFATMKQALLRQILAEAGSVRKAALRLQVPKSTLADWLKT